MKYTSYREHDRQNMIMSIDEFYYHMCNICYILLTNPDNCNMLVSSANEPDGYFYDQYEQKEFFRLLKEQYEQVN